MENKLIIHRPLYFSDKSDCGYCHGKKAKGSDFYSLESWYERIKENADSEVEELPVRSCTVGFQCENMTVAMYDQMCNMGFRRSGLFVYKMDALRSCCRLYTIRTRPDWFKLTKDMRKCINRFRKHVLGEPVANAKTQGYVEDIVDIEGQSDSINFYTRFGPAVYTDEKYELFSIYQERVHQDFDHSKKGFKRFLCDAPFTQGVIMGTEEEWEQLNNWKSMKPGERLLRTGPVHESYYYKGKLIALAVTDFLPSGISSVYFIWHPDYHKWSLGKLSALRELSLVSKTNLKYYYLGYYIDDCKKMNYKANYGGELLDSCTERYFKLSQVKDMIRGGKLFMVGTQGHDISREVALSDAIRDCIYQTDAFDIASDDNVAEKVYGTSSNIYRPQYLKEVISFLKTSGLEYDFPIYNDGVFNQYAKRIAKDGEDPDFTIPSICPGLIPLWELKDLLMSGKLQKELTGRTLVFDTSFGFIRKLEPWEDEDSTTKTAICDVVRLLGLEMASNSIVVV
ncbi:uncharacterized protein GVI51_A00187 [Nakaseomyces glabratus]|uniref:arginyltransferase n=1 Tax=Candida glabrata (strain ATCC 2001 / BCRC 20586 / JCM 3761 / NBRC 0622 / NRRL Y-65 / CBS 138) TaxID=284593 RepID=Q6FXV3_CANGA|nr:uncharacterized protein CAGL0A00319g [Nakaseomyces glabratus]KAH7591763.1 Arginine-tRNA-protein transferase, C terminus [Nakaseomyces glabratus]KAH7598793.1 Arginine-tRNA-protein transferase, C terminus [Nakaseomyces glabratus]KAH7609238.1 Arginine-tRNA-protein transferase, C terminus [Nakaseomyces glabratus]KAH7610111.1 Arginine-tRNA-protein transferase, C terminus [Nakaseomyces glabratus]KAI8400964.1 Arginine-tRNA-protein transferase, C terminus [Nakaseomyces glabratus]|eukprot:XP_444786.1 uncharacterized protein CAGL0A00319g [[Candida] glabrata]